MKIHHTGHGDNVCETDHGGKPFVANIQNKIKISVPHSGQDVIFR